MMADIDANSVISRAEEQNQTEATNGCSKPSFDNGQLSYLGHDIETIPPKIIEDYCNITHRLDLSFNRLVSLKGLQHFNSLKELILDNNDLGDSTLFPPLRDLHTLTLNKNKFKDLTELIEQFKVRFPNLTYLSLLGNQACPNQLSSSDKDDEDYQRYRYFVIFKLQKLKFLDSSPVTPVELAEARRVGPFMQVVRPTVVEDEDAADSPQSQTKESKYTPLPTGDDGREFSHQGTFGKSKYVYYGRHSEGNRFIRNRDL